MCTDLVRRPVLLTVLLTALAATVAQADFVGASLTGSQLFSGVDQYGHTLDVRVDYGVYDPGEFAGTFARWYAPDYSVQSTDYIYAYQIFNMGQSNTSTVLSQLSINTTGPVSAVGYLSGSQGLGADVGVIGAGGASIQYYFFGAGLLPGAHSNVLLAASPDPPAFLAASIYDHGASDAKTLPSPAPVPAPGAALLTLVGLGMVAKRKWFGA